MLEPLRPGTPENGEGNMAHPNADLVRKGFEAFDAGDMATLDAIMADDVVWHASGAGIVSGDFVGKQAVFGNFALIPQETDAFSQEIHAIVADDEHTMAARRRRSGSHRSTRQPSTRSGAPEPPG
jgi:ketosteroid isomerase-like protein